MSFDDLQRAPGAGSDAGAVDGADHAPAPGKQSLVGALQRKQGGMPGGPVGPAMAPTGGGQALPPDLRAQMEQSFQRDFSAVTVQEGAAAPAVGARAFTKGADLHFAPGEYQPGSPEGQELIGHELAHVVQQSEGRVGETAQAKGADGAVVSVNDDPSLEREADEQGARAARGEPAGTSGGGGAVGGALAPVQRKAGPIQRTAYANPTDAAISALMATANITDFGPYEWNDDNAAAPMFKLKAGHAWTLDDCVNKVIYQPEDPAKAVAGEKGKNSLVRQRVSAARKAIFGQAQGVIDKIMEHDEGRTPRDVVSLADEDAASGGHVVQRHILGEGLMAGHAEVALRAAFWKVGGVRMDLDAAGTATVFASGAGALAALKAAIAAELAANWAVHRVSLAKNTQVKITHAVAIQTVAYTKKDAPLGAPYAEAMMPKYIDNAKAGDRELYAGHYAGAGRPADPDGPDTAKDPLTTGGAKIMNNIYVIVAPNKDAPGGWAVYTTYPK